MAFNFGQHTSPRRGRPLA